MKQPDSVPVFETPLATCWLDGNILCVNTKNVERTEANTKEHYVILKSHLKKKVCWLVDITVCVNFQKASRLTIERELPKVCKAIAVIAQKPCEKVVAMLLVGAQKHQLPAEVFHTEKEAREWLETQACLD